MPHTIISVGEMPGAEAAARLLYTETAQPSVGNVHGKSPEKRS
ncbi:Uncharacterized protein dnl_43990 [Desulfonema limicola]|uniref:Uncharacterized protein n=1 Tax=Desulfonema limicola TaxID=45656 RepID=A0A975BAM0_9BACT|nr:Uncharacterized protein dnl_43990 [Desulfonema limicola]